MTTQTQAVEKKESRAVEYIPFGAQDKVRLTVEMVKNLIAVKTKTGKTCSDNEAIKFVAMCQARRLNPFEGDAYLIGYDGKDGPQFSLITAHQAFLKRAELNVEYDGMKSGLILERDGAMVDVEGDFYLQTDRVMGGWATVFFKNRKVPMHKRLRIERFRKAFGIWLDDAAGMIAKCAEADALRSSFPTMLGGLYMKEEQPLLAEVQASRPIFEPRVDDPIQPEKHQGDPAPEEIQPSQDTTELLMKAMKKEKMAESDVVAFAISIGLASEGVSSIAEMSPDAVIAIYKQLNDIAKRIKGEKP